jgi:putative heme-binding domain-containing protein
MARPAFADGADDAQAQQDATKIQILLRLDNIDVNANPKLKALVLRHLGRIKGTDDYVNLVEKLDIHDVPAVNDELLRLAIDKPDDTIGVGAAKLLVKFNDTARLAKALADKDDVAVKIITALGNTRSKEADALLEPVVLDTKRSPAVRNAAAAALGRSIGGQRRLLGIVTAGKLPDDLKFTVANALLASPDDAIRAEAGKHLSLPAAGGGEPLPPINELVQRKGDPARGHAVFTSQAVKCSTCHQVRGEGKSVGPDLSEIGDKLSREAFYTSILNPSAAVSFNFESWLVATDDGEQRVGILVSETNDSLTLKTPDALVTTIPKSTIIEKRKLTTSLMPNDLQRGMTAQQLVDLVEFLTTLKKPK